MLCVGFTQGSRINLRQ